MSNTSGHGRRLLRAAVIGLSTILAGTTAEAISFTEYTNRADWEAAVAATPQVSFTEETFDDAVLQLGLSYEFSPPVPGEFRPGATIDLGEFRDRLYPGSYTRWIFGYATFGFGADWDLIPDGQGPGLDILAADNSVIGQITFTAPPPGGFWGFVADDYFSSVAITTTPGGLGPETYDMDNLVYAAPEPGTLVLLGLGLAALRRATRRPRI